MSRTPIHAVFPGSFDPFTNGHLDLIQRGSLLFDKLTVAVLTNTHKQPLFTTDERVSMIQTTLSAESNIDVEVFSGLLVDYLNRSAATTILRGIRGLADYESEAQMAIINRSLRPGTETVFLIASVIHASISSRMVKEIASLGGNISAFVPSPVQAALRRKFPVD